MSDEAPRSRRSLDPDEPVVTIRKPGGGTISFTFNEYRLALIALVDFDSQWSGLEMASAFVVDGAAKSRLIQERLIPVAEHLDVLLTRGVDSLELLAARHWFRHGQVGERFEAS